MNHLPSLHAPKLVSRHRNSGSTGSGSQVPSGSPASGASGPAVTSNQGGPDSPAGLSLKDQYDRDKKGIIASCFAKMDEQGVLLESYITHVRIIEDQHYPSSPPPPTSPDSAKKHRVVILSVRKSGRVRVHKARENTNGSFQIGKTWNLDDLTRLDNDMANQTGFSITLGKVYYWQTHTSREKETVVNSILKIYKKYTNGRIPELNGFDSIVDPSLRTSSLQPAPSGPPSSTSAGRGGPSAAPVPSDELSTPPLKTGGFPGSSPISQISTSRTSVASPVTPAPRSSVSSASGAGPTPASRTPRQSVSSPGAAVPATSGAVAAAVGVIAAKSQSQNAPPQIRRPSQGLPAQSAASRYAAAETSKVPPSQPLSHVKQMQANLLKQAQTGSQSSLTLDTKTRSSVSTAATASPVSAKSTISIVPTKQSSDSRRPSQTPSQAPSKAPSERSVEVPVPPLSEVPGDRRPSAVTDRRSSTTPSSSVQPTISSTDLSEPIEKVATGVSIESAVSSVHLQAPSTDDVIGDGSLGHRRNHSSLHDIKVFAHTSAEKEGENPDSAIIIDDGHSADEAEQNDVVPNTIRRHRPMGSTSSSGRKVRRGSGSSTRSRASTRRRLSTISNASAIEDTLAEFNWNGRDDARTLEQLISKEMATVESANLHNVVDLDDRLDDLDKSLEIAVGECEKLDTMLAFFSVQLSSFGDDISHIEGQGQGLQVQTTNQKVLWNELNNLLQTVSLPEDRLQILRDGRFDTTNDLVSTESAVLGLFRAINAVRVSHGQETSKAGSGNKTDLSNIRAMREKRHIYEQATSEFVSRFKTYFDSQLNLVIREAEKHAPSSNTGEDPKVERIDPFVMRSLYPLAGLILFVKEVDRVNYESLLRTYQAQLRQYYSAVLASVLNKWKQQLAGMADKSGGFSFASPVSINEGSYSTGSSAGSTVQGVPSKSKSLKRTGTLARFKTQDSTTGSLKSIGSGASGSTTSLALASSASDESRSSTITTGALDLASRKRMQKILKKTMENLTSIVIAEQEVFTKLFHLSSFGYNDFADFVSLIPATKRVKPESEFAKLQIREVDPDYALAQEMATHMAARFESWQDQVNGFYDSYLKLFRVGAPSFIGVIDVYVNQLHSTNQDFLIQALGRLRDKATANWQDFVGQQIATISSTVVSAKKRTGVVRFVTMFPVFCQMLEDDLQGISTDDLSVQQLPVRAPVDSSYEKIGKTMFHTLQRIAKGSGPSGSNTQINTTGSTDYEDKEILNYHVMMIENMHVLMESLSDEFLDNGALQSIKLNAQSMYRQEMDLYILAVLHRPLGKIIELVQGIEAIVTKNPSENPAKRHGYSKSSFRKTVAAFDSKEVRKGVDTLRKRVEKHFGDAEGSNQKLLDKVWSAIQAQYSLLYSNLVRLENSYYLDTGDQSHIEFTKADITAAFARR